MIGEKNMQAFNTFKSSFNGFYSNGLLKQVVNFF